MGRLNLQLWLPKELHGAINPLLVSFGQPVIGHERHQALKATII